MDADNQTHKLDMDAPRRSMERLVVPLTSRQRRNAKSKAKKAKLKAERREHFESCCRGNLEPWDCYCSRGCDSCRCTHQCKKCGGIYTIGTFPFLHNATSEGSPPSLNENKQERNGDSLH